MRIKDSGADGKAISLLRLARSSRSLGKIPHTYGPSKMRKMEKRNSPYPSGGPGIRSPVGSLFSPDRIVEQRCWIGRDGKEALS